MELTCKICGRHCKSNCSLSAHIRHHHKMTVREYFDKYVEPWEHKCIRCGKSTAFVSLDFGYRVACNNVLCMRDARRETCLERYGDATYHNFEKQLETIHHTSKEEYARRVRKGKETRRKRYGCENYQNVSAIRETCIKKYGVDNAFKAECVKEKIKNVHREKRGVDYPSQSLECRKKTMETVLEHYGVHCISESREIQEKARQTRIRKYGSPNYRNVEKQKITVSKRSKQEWDRIRAKTRKTCLQRYGVDTPFGFCRKPASVSGLSRRVERILDAHPEVEYIQELRINFRERKEYRDFRAYDFAFGKVILELNGDYFHANPAIYNAEDIISIRHVPHTAQSIWEDDSVKRKLAESRGYRVVYLWECDMKKMSDDELFNWIKRNCIEKERLWCAKKSSIATCEMKGVRADKKSTVS